jgi:Phosphoserine phosphatase RsbU, N-terminal domain
MTGEEERFRRDYTPPLLAHLGQPHERTLLSAYELGRRAMTAELGLLTLVRVHHDVLLEVLASARDVEEATALVSGASSFLAEALASFEMGQRGFMAGEGRAAPRDATPKG